MAQAKEALMPRASQFIFCFMKWQKYEKSNVVAKY
jgi:hypothetical protein